MNNVMLKGRLVATPYYSYGKDGRSVGMLTLAVPNMDVRDSKGENPVDYIKCVVFNGLANVLEKYADKGTEIIVTSGKLSSGSYEKDGQTVYTTEVIIDKFEFGNNKRNEVSNGTEKKSSRKSA